MTYADMVEDFWANAHAKNPELRLEAIDGDFDETVRDLGLDPAVLKPRQAPDDTEIVDEVNYGGVP